jgi:hypothetical protein
MIPLLTEFSSVVYLGVQQAPILETLEKHRNLPKVGKLTRRGGLGQHPVAG